MDVQTAAATGPGQSDGTAQAQGSAAPPAPAPVSQSTTNESDQPSQGSETLASAVAKLYNVSSGSSGEPAQLNVSYKYVNQLQLVVTVFTNPETGEEIQFPPQELIGLAEMFDQIDGVTLDRKV